MTAQPVNQNPSPQYLSYHDALAINPEALVFVPVDGAFKTYGLPAILVGIKLNARPVCTADELSVTISQEDIDTLKNQDHDVIVVSPSLV